MTIKTQENLTHPTEHSIDTTAHLLRLPEVERMIGLRCAAVYKRIRAGLLTPPVNIGIRTSTWPQHEIVYLNLALVSGKSDDDIRRLVSNMIEQRKQERNGHE